jgi:hypothetical protein
MLLWVNYSTWIDKGFYYVSFDMIGNWVVKQKTVCLLQCNMTFHDTSNHENTPLHKTFLKYTVCFLTSVSISLPVVILVAKYFHTKGRALICDLLCPCCLSIHLYFNAWDGQTVCRVPYSWSLLKRENMVFILRYRLLNSWTVNFCRVS